MADLAGEGAGWPGLELPRPDLDGGEDGGCEAATGEGGGDGAARREERPGRGRRRRRKRAAGAGAGPRGPRRRRRGGAPRGRWGVAGGGVRRGADNVRPRGDDF